MASLFSIGVKPRQNASKPPKNVRTLRGSGSRSTTHFHAYQKGKLKNGQQNRPRLRQQRGSGLPTFLSLSHHQKTNKSVHRR